MLMLVQSTAGAWAHAMQVASCGGSSPQRTRAQMFVSLPMHEVPVNAACTHKAPCMRTFSDDYFPEPAISITVSTGPPAPERSACMRGRIDVLSHAFVIAKTCSARLTQGAPCCPPPPPSVTGRGPSSSAMMPGAIETRAARGHHCPYSVIRWRELAPPNTLVHRPHIEVSVNLYT
jgi:hypothetical protein